MKLLDWIRGLFSGKKKEAEAESQPAGPAPGSRPQKACKGCGRMFSYDPGWEHIPNYCKECRKKFIQEREEKQRAGAPRRIKRKCKACGKYFTFPNTLEHYPNYCGDCRKKHQAEMKEKYSGKKKKNMK